MSLMKNIPIAFNLENPRDRALYEYAQSWGKGKVSTHMKRLIEMDYHQHQKTLTGIRFTLEQGKHQMKKS